VNARRPCTPIAPRLRRRRRSAPPASYRQSMPSAPESTVWPVLHYDDTAGALRFLVDAFGLALRSPSMTTTEIPSIPSCAGRPAAQSCFARPSRPAASMGEMRAGPSAVYVVADDVDAVLSASRRRERRDRPTTAPDGARFRGPDARGHRPGPRGHPLDVRHLRGAHWRRAAWTRFPSPGSRSVRASRRRLANARVGRAASAPSRTTSTTAIAYRSGRALPRWPCSRRSSRAGAIGAPGSRP
jgi:hypothetical protein